MSDRPTSSFSRRLAAALRGYVRERGLRQSDLAEALDRSPGYVSEHLKGRRAVDTDMMDAVAHLAGISSGRLYEEIGRRMSNSPEPPDDAAERIVHKARADAAAAKSEKSPTADQAKSKPPRRTSQRGA